MEPFVWQEGISDEEAKNGAYWERNMLALFIGILSNDSVSNDPRRIDCGWYWGGIENYGRVISLFNGEMTFHVPDGFDLGRLQEIEPNWDGHTTEEKWERVMKICGCNTEHS